MKLTMASTNRRPHSSEAIFFWLDNILTVMPLGHDRHWGMSATGGYAPVNMVA